VPGGGPGGAVVVSPRIGTRHAMGRSWIRRPRGPAPLSPPYRPAQRSSDTPRRGFTQSITPLTPLHPCSIVYRQVYRQPPFARVTMATMVLRYLYVDFHNQRRDMGYHGGLSWDFQGKTHYGKAAEILRLGRVLPSGHVVAVPNRVTAEAYTRPLFSSTFRRCQGLLGGNLGCILCQKRLRLS